MLATCYFLLKIFVKSGPIRTRKTPTHSSFLSQNYKRQFIAEQKRIAQVNIDMIRWSQSQAPLPLPPPDSFFSLKCAGRGFA